MMNSSFKRFQTQMDKNFSEQAKKFAEQQKQFEANINERFQSLSKVGDFTMPNLDFGFKPFTSMFDSNNENIGEDGGETGLDVPEGDLSSQMNVQSYSNLNGKEKKITMKQVTKDGKTVTTKTIVEDGVTTIEV